MRYTLRRKVVTMYKAQVYKRANGIWVVGLRYPTKFPQALTSDTWDEAMFLAQLLADPHEYIRAAQERAWHGGKSVGRLQEYFKIPGPTSPYQKEDQ